MSHQVCSREHHLGNCVLTVRLYDEANEDEKNCNRVIASGVPQSIGKDFLELYFESEKRSGGGSIADLKLHPQHGKVVILYSDNSG